MGGRVGKKTCTKNQVISPFAIEINFAYNIRHRGVAQSG
jgi:hypothetical protein